MKRPRSKTTKPAAKTAVLEPPTGLMAGMVRLETPDGFGYVQGTPGAIDIISARVYYAKPGRPPAEQKPEDRIPGRWLTTRTGNKLFVLSTIENRKALGLPEE